eukprot:713875-Pleurochrysis_carterae.AAC.2
MAAGNSQSLADTDPRHKLKVSIATEAHTGALVCDDGQRLNLRESSRGTCRRSLGRNGIHRTHRGLGWGTGTFDTINAIAL